MRVFFLYTRVKFRVATIIVYVIFIFYWTRFLLMTRNCSPGVN